MLTVLEVAKHVFWNDKAFERKLLPSEASLEKCKHSLADLATMSGKERISVFKQCDIDPSLFPLFLRALQHVTAAHGSGKIEDHYMIHRHLSAHQWNPFSSNTPLLGYPTVNSLPYKEKCVEKGRSRYIDDATIVGKGSRGISRYNGLLNQGATCYLNSLLQALFHISAFRSIIYQMPTKEEAGDRAHPDNTEHLSIPYALQRLFCHLQTSTRAVGTKELTESFGWGASDSFIQHDVHELTRVLLDNLEEKLTAQQANPDLPSKSQENAIHRLFTGSLESYVKVEEAGYYGSREEPFYDLQLVVKSKKNIYASFDAFFQVEVLDGKNKYCLEQNGQKSYHRAEKGVRFKEIPPILLLHLARFDYDIHQGETKVFTRWDYYNTLDLSRYMMHVPPEMTHYTLCSVLVHSGSNTGFGHYFCFVMCSGAWYKFNDETVTPATLKEVFGDNFGGFRLNYWGSEVPNTANAYMLVYIRTSQWDSLLRSIGAEDVPHHVLEQLEREQREEMQRAKERAEDYLYGRVHFIYPSDIASQEEFLISRRPVSHKFSSHRTLRLLLDAEALPAFREFLSQNSDHNNENELFWFASSTNSTSTRLCHRVTEDMRIKDLLQTEKECCILVSSPATSPLIYLGDESSLHEYEIYHHKLYDPLQLKVYFLGCTVLYRSPSVDAQKAVEAMESFVRDFISELPDESTEFHVSHLKQQGERKLTLPSQKTSVASLDTCRSQYDPVLKDDDGVPHGKRNRPTEKLTVLCEKENHSFVKCDSMSSGDILVWQLDTCEKDAANIFYPDIESFQHFLHHRIPVEIKLNQYPSYPTLIDTELAEDMTYEQLQRYVAHLIGDVDNYDRIRFSRHNPDTEMPYFMKGKKQDRPTLTKLLTPATARATALSRYIYYEYCKYTVTEIENAHSLQFKLYSDSVKVISSHWILLPRSAPITANVLFGACAREIQKDYAAGEYPAVSKLLKDSTNSAESSTLSFVRNIMNMDNAMAFEALRLADVWRGRIYNVLDKDHPLEFEHHTFEESAEYRIESIPRPIPGVSLQHQLVFQVHHFSMVRQRRDSVETHSEPFSMYIDDVEQPNHFLRRVAAKLELSYAAVQDWKVCLVKESRVVATSAEVPMGRQLSEFCPLACYQPNQTEPSKAAFIGLEHAPLSKRATKREDKVLILN